MTLSATRDGQAQGARPCDFTHHVGVEQSGPCTRYQESQTHLGFVLERQALRGPHWAVQLTRRAVDSSIMSGRFHLFDGHSLSWTSALPETVRDELAY